MLILAQKYKELIVRIKLYVKKSKSISYAALYAQCPDTLSYGVQHLWRGFA